MDIIVKTKLKDEADADNRAVALESVRAVVDRALFRDTSVLRWKVEELDTCGLRSLLQEIDGQLGLAVHRNEAHSDLWKAESDRLISRVRAMVKSLEMNP